MCPGLRTGLPVTPPAQSCFRPTCYGYELYIGAVGKSSWFTHPYPGVLWVLVSEQRDTSLIELLGNFKGIYSMLVEY